MGIPLREAFARCDATGRIEVSRNNNFTGEWWQTLAVVNCPDCGGTGRKPKPLPTATDKEETK